MQQHRITMLGTGLIGDFYTMTLHGQRGRDRVRVVYSRTRGARRGVQRAVGDPGAHDRPRGRGEPSGHRRRRGRHCRTTCTWRPSRVAAAAGKAVLCTKPLGRNADEAQRILETVEKAGVFGGLPRGPVLHAEDAEGDRVGRGRRDR